VCQSIFFIQTKNSRLSLLKIWSNSVCDCFVCIKCTVLQTFSIGIDQKHTSLCSLLWCTWIWEEFEGIKTSQCFCVDCSRTKTTWNDFGIFESQNFCVCVNDWFCCLINCVYKCSFWITYWKNFKNWKTNFRKKLFISFTKVQWITENHKQKRQFCYKSWMKKWF